MPAAPAPANWGLGPAFHASSSPHHPSKQPRGHQPPRPNPNPCSPGCGPWAPPAAQSAARCCGEAGQRPHYCRLPRQTRPRPWGQSDHTAKGYSQSTPPVAAQRWAAHAACAAPRRGPCRRRQRQRRGARCALQRRPWGPSASRSRAARRWRAGGSSGGSRGSRGMVKSSREGWGTVRHDSAAAAAAKATAACGAAQKGRPKALAAINRQPLAPANRPTANSTPPQGRWTLSSRPTSPRMVLVLPVPGGPCTSMTCEPSSPLVTASICELLYCPSIAARMRGGTSSFPCSIRALTGCSVGGATQEEQEQGRGPASAAVAPADSPLPWLP